MTKAEDYRKRAAAATKTSKGRKAIGDRKGLDKKAKALTDMAENEDWLDGKPKPKSTSR